MSASSLSFSAPLIPLNLLPQDINIRCVSVSSPKAIKNQFRPMIRRSIGTGHRVPSFSGMVAESGNVQSPTSVPVRVANELLQAGHHYLDVRTAEEFSAGHVVGAVNVPFMLRVGQGMVRNPKFLEEVMIHYSKDDEIIVGCQLGKRSLMAASELVSAWQIFVTVMDFDLNSGLGMEAINSLGNEDPSEDEMYNKISGDGIDNNISGDEMDGLTASDSEDGDENDGGLAVDLEGLGCNGDGEIGGGGAGAHDDCDRNVVADDNEISVEEPVVPASNELFNGVVGKNPVPNNTNLVDDGSLSEADTILLRDVEKRLSIGANVRDLDEAYLLYCEYGRLKGFGVRKGEQRYVGRNDTIKWKEFMCCCAGQPDTKRQKEAVPAYKKILIRTGCKAKLRVSRSLGSPWRVSIFLTDHNHGLVASEMTYMLRSSRNLSTVNALILEALQASGIGVSGAVRFLEKLVALKTLVLSAKMPMITLRGRGRSRCCKILILAE